MPCRFWHDLGLVVGVAVRQPLVRALGAALVFAIALITVGLSAAADGPFSIAVRPVFVRLGIDVNIKLGSLHLHANWSALPPDASEDGAPPTKTPAGGL